MSWLYLVLISVTIASFSNILQRVLMKDKKSDAVISSIGYCVIVGIFYLVIALFHGFHFPPFNTTIFFILLACGLWSAGLIFFYKSLQLLESSEVTIITSVRALISIFGSIIFLHEFFSIQKSIGTVILLGSVFLVTHMKKGFKFNHGVYFALGMALFNGIAIVVDAYILKTYDVLSYLALANIIMAIMMTLCFPKTITKWKSFVAPSFLSKMFPAALFGFSQSIFYYFAIAIGPTSQITPINQSQVILTVLIAAVLLKERDHLKVKIVASILAMVGVILLR